MKNKKWSEKELSILKENYPKSNVMNFFENTNPVIRDAESYKVKVEC